MKAPLDADDLNNRDHLASHNEMPHHLQSAKDQQINELSDMVKELLREQQELKEQLNRKEDDKKPPIGSRKAQLGGLNKKSSERVPRQGGSLVNRAEYHFNGPSSRDRESENPRAFLNLPLQVKPGEGDPKSNIQQQKVRQTNLEKRRKEQQEKEKSKLDAIEAKIENARKRLEEKKKIKSQIAKNTIKQPRKNQPNGAQSQNYMNDSDGGNEDLDELYVDPRAGRNRVQQGNPNRFRANQSSGHTAQSEIN